MISKKHTQGFQTSLADHSVCVVNRLFGLISSSVRTNVEVEELNNTSCCHYLQIIFQSADALLDSLTGLGHVQNFSGKRRIETQSALSAASVLIQSAEATFRKQKRALAAAEFKQAMIAFKRRAKIFFTMTKLVSGPSHVLVHLFCLLDAQSLLTAGLVCRMWNAAANDGYLWELQYNNYFGDSESISKTKQHMSSSEMCSNANQNKKDDSTNACLWQFQYNNLFDSSENTLKTVGKQHAPSSALGTNINRLWKYDFKEAYLAFPNKFGRAFCLRCKSVVWLNNQCRGQHPLRPLYLNEIGRYIMGDEESDDDFTSTNFMVHGC